MAFRQRIPNYKNKNRAADFEYLWEIAYKTAVEMDGKMNFKIAVHTDIGIKKRTNQDSVLVRVAQTDFGNVLLCAICDGMGGLAKGELASATMVRMLSKWFEEEFPELLYQGIREESLKKSWSDLIERANQKISSYGLVRHINLGTTMAVLLITDQNYFIVNVGDSRIYQLKKGFGQLTKDQTVVQREVDLGKITEKDAGKDPRRNILLQCIGASQTINPQYVTGKVESGNLFLLCSDGFRHVVTPEELQQYLKAEFKNEHEMKNSLLFLTELNKSRYETDNISAALIRAE